MPNYTNSVWTETPSDRQYSPLTGEIEVDIAVIGAGITGVTTAYLLKLAGYRVALVESRRVGKGETGKTTAHLTEVLDTRYHQLISRFGVGGARLACQGQRAAIERIRRLVEQLNIDCQLESVPGYLYAESADQVSIVDREEEAARKIGLSATAVDEVPLPFPVVRALRFDEQAQLDARRYLLALVGHIDGGGCHVFEQTHVVDVKQPGGADEPCIVKTAGGVIRAREVVVATHVPIIDTLTMPTKVAAYRTYAVGMALPDAGPRGLFWDVADPYHYIRTHVVGGAPTLIVGGEDHKVGEEDDTVVPFERLEAYVLNHFHRPVAATDHRWSGQVLEPVDGLPYIGRVSGRDSTDGHLYLATGYSGNGITGGTLAAMIITDQIRGVDNAYGKLFEPGRVKPVASAAAFIGENVDFPKHLVADHLPRLGKSDLDAVQRLAAGEGVVARVGGNKLAVYRNGRGELSALSPVCTHLGCLVHWNTTEKSWDCPCHGSRFDPLGRVLNGPATAALEAKPLPDELSAAGRGAGAAQPAAPASGKQG